VPVPTGGSEALRELTEHAARRKADELAATLAERALRVTRGADFAVARDALDALLRRLESSRDDDLVVRSAPPGFRVGRRGRGKLPARGYNVWLGDTGDASCSCPDFAKAALGAVQARAGGSGQPAPPSFHASGSALGIRCVH